MELDSIVLLTNQICRVYSLGYFTTSFWLIYSFDDVVPRMLLK